MSRSKHNSRVNGLILDIKNIDIKEGDVFSNYPKLCNKLGIEPVLRGCAKDSQIKEIKRYIDFERLPNSQSIIIKKVYDTPIKREDKRHTLRNNNSYDLGNHDYGVGYTNKGDMFYFDKEDYDLIKEYCWRLEDDRIVAYAKNSKDSWRKIRLDRLILNVTGTKNTVIHINNNSADNRKANLREVNRGCRVIIINNYNN